MSCRGVSCRSRSCRSRSCRSWRRLSRRLGSRRASRTGTSAGSHNPSRAFRGSFSVSSSGLSASGGGINSGSWRLRRRRHCCRGLRYGSLCRCGIHRCSFGIGSPGATGSFLCGVGGRSHRSLFGSSLLRWGLFGSGLLRRGLFGSSLFGWGLLGLRWLLVADQTLALSLATHTISLGLNHTRRVALDPNTQRVAEIQALFVGEPQFFCQLVDPDICHS